jgi:hypothetical protein
MTHEVRMRITDSTHPELVKLGLPSLQNFSTTDSKKGKKTQWTWAAHGEESSNADLLTQLLQDHHIAVSDFEPGAFHDLIDEVYETSYSTLVVRNGELMRHLEIVKLWITADILSVPHTLVTKSKVQYGKRETTQDRPISMRIRKTEDWKEACGVVLQNRLGLDRRFQTQNVLIDEGSYRLFEEVEYSRSYPGLKSVYRIHEIQCRILDPAQVVGLGLPEGNDFAFSRSSGEDEDDVVVTYFRWKTKQDTEMSMGKRKTDQFERSLLDRKEAEEIVPDPKRRLTAPQSVPIPAKDPATPGSVIKELMRGKKADWTCAKRAAQSIRNPDYTVGEFYKDCLAAFPELALYVACTIGEIKTTSGRSADDEFQRTASALFAVFWLMRLDGDGRHSFSYGVDDNWKALSEEATKPKRPADEIARRSAFCNSVEWQLFEAVLVQAGLLEKGNDDRIRHNEERTLGMLALTAIHDIMKIQALLPTVDKRHGAFCGYQPGEVISDHDIALGYMLEHFPDQLPSYAALPKRQQDSVKFTQCNMEYNMGWLVQAEAPPGALFRKFKSIIQSGKASQSDIAFYFTHWLTDLAGAEPYPQEGCEKFVLKFPQKVLTSFLTSFKFVEELGQHSETQVFEDYLTWRWKTSFPGVEMPSGKGSIARIRLTVMTQGQEKNLLTAYDNLAAKDQEVLDIELARTGCQGQQYTLNTLSEQSGPAFLVYYAPALMCKNASSNAAGALNVLAEVLRQARVLWPLDNKAAGETVTLRIDALKELEVHAMLHLPPGEFFALQKTSNKDAHVKRMGLGEANESNWSTMRMLTFTTGNAVSNPGADAFSTGRKSSKLGSLPCVQEESHVSVMAVQSIDSTSTNGHSCCCSGKTVKSGSQAQIEANTWPCTQS